MKKIAVLTSGGDAPGMNAAIRAVVRTATYYGVEIYGIERGWEGLLTEQIIPLNNRSVSDRLHRGGTFLKTARCDEFVTKEGRCKAAATLKKYGIEGIVTIGGDGTFHGAQALSAEHGIKCTGIPGTIDNDLGYTDFTLGFDTAVNTVLSAINNLRDTMQSHDRVSFVEVMGRNCGDIALYAGIAGGAEFILLPEKPFDLDEVANGLVENKLKGKNSDIIVFAEGAGNRDEIVKYLKEKTGADIKVTILGHVQRGGSPTMQDRILASRFGVRAVKELLDPNSVSCAIGIKDNQIITYPFVDIFGAKKPFKEELYNAAQILSK